MAVSTPPETPELNPETLSDDLVVSAPEHVAAGMPAVVSAMKHAVREMGPVRGTRELFMLNQFQFPGVGHMDVISGRGTRCGS